MNNKGEKLISIYWFAILILVAGGITAMVYIFYSSPYDVREIEGNLMANKLADCIYYSGYLNDEIFSENFSDSFLEKCHIDFNVEDDWEEEQYYLGAEIFDIDKTLVLEFSAGNKNLLSSCEIENDDYNTLAKCVESKFYAAEKGGVQYLIKILSVVRKSEKNVK